MSETHRLVADVNQWKQLIRSRRREGGVTYTFLPFSNIPSTLSIALLAASSVSKCTNPNPLGSSFSSTAIWKKVVRFYIYENMDETGCMKRGPSLKSSSDSQMLYIRDISIEGEMIWINYTRFINEGEMIWIKEMIRINYTHFIKPFTLSNYDWIM